MKWCVIWNCEKNKEQYSRLSRICPIDTGGDKWDRYTNDINKAYQRLSAYKDYRSATDGMITYRVEECE